MPKSFLPIGDSGFLFGVMIAQEGASPSRCATIRTRRTQIIRADPAVEVAFTLTGFSQFSRQPGIPDRLPETGTSARRFQHAVAGNDGKLLPRSIREHIRPSARSRCCRSAPARPPTATRQIRLRHFRHRRRSGQCRRPDRKNARVQYNGKPAFRPIQPDELLQTRRSLQIDILRDQAATYGVSTTAIENTIRQAYSQNYVYLIKKPEDQFQVILEAADAGSHDPQRSQSLLYVRSDDGARSSRCRRSPNGTKSSARRTSITSTSFPR
jgi:hydrophobic/amphiphilic exporter-1 (mainly G- bacteria), HAE1 family